MANHEGKNAENLYTDETVNNPDQHGNVPLHNAVIQNDEGMLSNLLQHGCIDLNLKNRRGDTPLLLAISENRPYSFIMQFIHAGADLNATNELGQNSLHMAFIYRYDEKLLPELLKNGVNINVQDHFKRTPLHYAVEADNMEAVCMLLYYAADVSILDNRNKNPFSVAICHNKIKIAEILFDYYDDFSDADCDGYTPLHFAIERDLPIAFNLIKAGADVNCITHNKKNPLVMCLGWERMRMNMELFQLIWPKFNYRLLLNAEFPFLQILMFSLRFYASACEFLKVMHLVLNCPVIVELLDYNYKNILPNRSCYSCGVFTDVLPLLDEFKIQLRDRLNIINTLLSLGAKLNVFEINSVLILFGFNEELEMILYCCDSYAGNDRSQNLSPQCSFIFSTNDLNIKTVIQLFKNFLSNMIMYSGNYEEYEKCVHNNLGFFSISSDLKAELINYCSRDDVIGHDLLFEEYSPLAIAKISSLPEFPSLIELSRNQARKFIMQTFKITKAYQFHDIVKKLKLPNSIRDILRFKTPLY